MEICSKESCTGCGACENICPVAAIFMQENGRGFLYPTIDEQKCISCQKCRKVCPQTAGRCTNPEGSVIAAMAKNDALRNVSSSGGVFSLLAEWCLRHDGIVFGAAYDSEMNVRHLAVTSLDDLPKLRGSKYVQGRTDNTYQEAKTTLEANKYVLYSGTPCQIAGLYAFLGKNYKKLLTVDILCHGTPSPAVFRKYTDYIQKTNQCKIADIQFRCKNPGWKDFTTKISLMNGEIVILYRDAYMDGFLRNIYLRDSCYQCPYAASTRAGDITLGDYWGYQETAPHFMEDDDRGISFVMINTPGGKRALRRIRGKLVWVPRTIEDARRGNKILSSPFSAPEETNEFWNLFSDYTWEQLSERFNLGGAEMPESYSQKKREYFALPLHKRRFGHILERCAAGMLRRIRRN